MAKKAIVGIVAAVLVGVFLFGTRFFGYLGTGVENVRQAAQDAVPFEMKLAEAKKSVTKLDGTIESHMRTMADIKTDRDTLDKTIAQTGKAIKGFEQEMAYLASLLNENESGTVYVNTTKGKEEKSVAEVTSKLKATKANYDRAQKNLVSDTKSREQKQKLYDEHVKQLNQLDTLRKDLTNRIKELETQQAVLKTRKATEAAQYDESDVQEAQAIIDELEKSLNRESNLLDIKQNNGTFDVELNTPSEDEGNILEEVNKALEGKNVQPSVQISTEIN
jgi:chromosome segregation ATPase